MLLTENNRPWLILLQSTDASVSEFIQKGLWERQRYTLSQYAGHFYVHYYTSDKQNMQHLMPEGVRHETSVVASARFGLRHFLYYLFLIAASFNWRNKNYALIRGFGVNLPVVPILKFISGKRVVLSYQFDWAYGMKKDYKGIKPLISGFVQRRVINAADHLICTTKWLEEIARTRYGKANTTVIPNYVDTEKFKPNLLKSKQIVFTGRLHWSKGVDVLINAFREFAKEHPEYQLIILGAGEEESKLRHLAVGMNVVFKGSVSNNEVAKILNESEIFVLPSVNMEGHPKALIEAMAAGCKCIASDVPGNNNVLIDSNSAELLFTSKDVPHLLEKLILSMRLNTNNQRNFALNNYTASHCFGEEIKILKF